MAAKSLRQKLELAIARGEPFGPSEEEKQPAKVKAKMLRELILKGSKDGAQCLWLRRTRITGTLDLEAQQLDLCIKLDGCEVDETLNLRQASATDLRFFNCRLRGGLAADQIEVRWNLLLDQSEVDGAISLGGAAIGGRLSMRGAVLTAREDRSGRPVPVLSADGSTVAGGMLCDRLTTTGEVRFLDAKIGGPLSFRNSTLSGRTSNEGIPVPAINADRSHVTGSLFCDRIAAVGGVRLLGAKVGGQLSMSDARIEGAVREDGVVVPALNIDRCQVAGSMFWDGLAAVGEVRLLGAKVGGQLSMERTKFSGTLQDTGSTTPALSADGVEIGGDMFCGQATVHGDFRLVGAKVGGQLSVDGATLEGKTDDEGADDALSADRIQVSGGMLCNGLTATGEVRLLGAEIGGQLSINGANLTAGSEGDTANSIALNIDRADIAGDMFCDGEFTVKGEMRLLGARIGGQMSMDGARLEGRMDGVGAIDAFSADGAEIAESMFCDRLTAIGQMRLLGTRIGGQMSLSGATLEGKVGEDGTSDTLCGDRMEVAGGMFCVGLTATGQVRLLSAKIGAQLCMDGAKLSGAKDGNGAVTAALSADRVEVGGSVFCREGFTATGRVQMSGAKIDGQLSLSGASLVDGPDSKSELTLVAARIDELIVAFRKVDGAVDLRSATVRSLWDAEKGKFVGQLPGKLKLEGFGYRSLREPLGAKQRLVWIGASQGERHYPGVYTELANAFRRIGHLGDARKIAIASERRARQDTRKWSYRRLWHDLLWVTIGYGYRDWLAAIWLLGLIGIGSVLFALSESSFVATIPEPPAFNPVLYAIDITIPVLDIGQTRVWSATGCLSWVGLVLAVAGYALVAAVIAAAAGLFSRDQG